MSGSTGQTLGFVAGAVLGYFTGGASYIALGATIGGAVGGAIDPPKGPHIEGPRLNDLSVQTATYGAVIPRVYGTVALLGNIFWLENNQLQERSKTESQGGKGGGGGAESTTYSYYATFAVGLCEGPIAGVRRIWVGSKLIYDAGSSDISTIIASNASSELFTIHNGAEDQSPDDRMQATLGVANTPAYRGLAYVVFKDYPLAEHGNSLLGAQVKVEVVKIMLTPAAVTVLDSTMNKLRNGYFVEFNAITTDGPIVLISNNSDLYKIEAWLMTDGTPKLLKTFPAPSFDGVDANNEFGYGTSDFPSFIVKHGNYLQSNPYLIGIFSSGRLIYKHAFATYNTTGISDTLGYSSAVYANKGDMLVLGTVLNTTVGLMLFKGNSGDLIFQNKYITGSTSRSILITDFNIYVIATDLNTVLEFDLLLNYVASSPTPPGGIGLASTARLVKSKKYKYEIISSSHGSRYGFDGVSFVLIQTDMSYGLFSGSRFCVIENDLIYHYAHAVGSNYGHAVALKVIPNGNNQLLSSIVQSEVLSSNLINVNDIDVTGLTQPVRGYRVANVAAIRSAIEPLQGAWPFDALQSGYKIKFKPRGGAVVATIPAIDLDSREAGKGGGVSITVGREMDSILPARVILKHIDVNREYDQGEQYAERLNTAAVNISTVEMPIVMTAGEAAANVEMLLYLYWLERYDVSFSLPPTYNGLEPADVITINATAASYELRLTAINYTSDGRLECTAKYNAAAIYSPTALGEEGQSTGAVLTLTGSTAYELLDIPLLLDATDLPGFPVAMTGYLAGWPGGTVFRSDDAGQTWGNLQTFVAPGAAMGSAGTALGSGRLGMFDQAAVLSVSLISGALSSVTEAALLNGANHFAYGAHGRWEIIAAKTCTLQGDGSYVLTDLLRGRFGSEHACASHVTGDSIVLLDSNKLAFVTANLNTIGAPRTYRGITAGKALTTDSDKSFTYTGVNLECLAPVYLNGNRHPTTNDWSLDWIRRTRIGGELRDYVDATLGETTQAYEVEIYSSAAYTTLKRTITGLVTPAATYTSAQQVTDFGSNQATLYVKVYQLSANVGRGYPLTISITR